MSPCPPPWRGKSFSRLLLIVGPEGGWEEEEVRQAREAGAVPVSLGIADPADGDGGGGDARLRDVCKR